MFALRNTSLRVGMINSSIILWCNIVNFYKINDTMIDNDVQILDG
jgi:hypothetical protein